MSPASSRTISKSQPSSRSGRSGEILLKRRTQSNRPQIDVKAELFAQAEQSRFGPRSKRQRFPLRAADRAQKNRVRRAASRKSFIGQRHSARVNRVAAKWEFAKFKVVPERRSAILQALEWPRA